MASTSYHSARVTTSASSPSMTARAWAPEPPCDCLTVTVWPAESCQDLAKSALSCWYSSRVGSYETFKISTGFLELGPGAAGVEHAAASARTSAGRRQRNPFTTMSIDKVHRGT